VVVAGYMHEFRKLVAFQAQHEGPIHFKMRLSFDRGRRSASFFGRPAYRPDVHTSGPIVEHLDVGAFVAWEQAGYVRTLTAMLQPGVTVFRLTELGVQAAQA
jgi:hypothetical protein